MISQIDHSRWANVPLRSGPRAGAILVLGGLLTVALCHGARAQVPDAAATPAGPRALPFKSSLVRGGDRAQALALDVAGVDDLYLVVTFGPDSYRSDQAIWAEPVLVHKDGRSVDLTTLKPAAVQLGWGNLCVNKNQRSKPLSIAGQSFNRGFWAHGPSMLHFKLGGQYTTLTTQVGIDTGAGRSGSVEFEVTSAAPKMPAKKVYTRESKVVKGQTRPTALVKVSAANEAPRMFNKEAAQVLLREGVDRLVFVRRFTLTANHVYTEHVNSRWMPGGGLAVLDLKTGVATDLIPELGVGVINRFDISYDAKRLVFDYKKSSSEGYRIYEFDLASKDLKQLTFPTEGEPELVRLYASKGYHHGTDDMHPCYLPDGGIVFSTTRCQYGVLCNAGDVYTTTNLYRMNGDGSGLRPLSNSPVNEASPAVLPDGRIIYHRWEYLDKAAGNVKCLWAMNPDGTATAEVYGNMITFPETMIYPRPIPGARGKVVMLGCSHCCPNNAMGAVVVVDMLADVRSEDAMFFVTDDIRALAHTGFHFRDKNGKWKLDKTGKLGRLFKDPYPIWEDLFIASRKPKGAGWSDAKSYDLVLLDGIGTETLLYSDDEISCWHAYPLRPRPKPPTIPSSTDPVLARQGLARFIVSDVYAGMDGVERGSVKHLRVLAQVPRPWAVRKSWYRDDRDGMAHSAIGKGHLGLKVQYGIVPVEADGSAHFVVPAKRNIYLQALDANLLAIQTERTYVHSMPGESRSCVGCHERPGLTQRAAAGTLAAMQRRPSVPAPQPGETTAERLFDYDRQIQPIWDRHCLKCHSGKTPKAKLDLSGTPKGVFSVSYNSLIARSNKSPLLGNREPRNENKGSAGVGYQPPYSLGALTSTLAAMLSHGRITLRNAEHQASAEKLAKTHLNVRVSAAELLAVTNWLDVNCPFHPSYWGRLNAKYEKHPNYRPEIGFDDALCRRVPKAVAQAESEGE